MNTITLTAYSRPLYTESVITSLAMSPSLSKFDAVIVSIDPSVHQSRIAEITLNALGGLIDVTIDAHKQKLGVDWNNLHAFKRAVAIGSDLNVCVEDDTVLSPDALDFCLWFGEMNHDQLLSGVLFNECASTDRFATQIINGFCPWGWCFTRKMFEKFISPQWMKECKWSPNTGWDWSMTQIAIDNNLRFIRPSLSRCLNIGAFGGTYETPEHHAEVFKSSTAATGWESPQFRL